MTRDDVIRVMAILNVTPDSFYAGSRTPDAAAIETRVREALSGYIYRRTKRSPMILPILLEV